MKQIPILIDCDPGVDDSYAIALANACPSFHVVALTAVEGNVPAALTRRNCLCLRELFEMHDCKVAFGAEYPLCKAYDRALSDVHGEGGVGGISFPAPLLAPAPIEASELIYEEAVKHSGELILFATGPLTNIALALRRHPDLPQHIRKFIIMGGGTFGNVAVTGRKAEFNIWVDPTAAKEVFQKMEVWMVGLNATHAAALSAADLDDMLRLTAALPNKQVEFLHRLTAFSKENSFGRGHDNNVIHDALAIAAAIDPMIVRFEPCCIAVEDRAVSNEGETVILPPDPAFKLPLCHIAMQVDQPRFAQLMKDMCKYYAAQDLRA